MPRNAEKEECRSFISIIFPKRLQAIRKQALPSVSILYKYHISQQYLLAVVYHCIVSILYKYHISQKTLQKEAVRRMKVSILYKYHISLTKYSTFWALVDKIVKKRLNLVYFFRPSRYFVVFFVLKILQNRSMVEKFRFNYS